MSDGTKIEWSDATWNPVTGCTKIGPGCDHCYAETMHERFHGKGSFATVTLAPHRLDVPLKWRKPRRVFVNSMSDLFHDDVPDEYIARVFAVMAACPQHTFQVLTKRHARMRSLLNNREWRTSMFTRESVLPGPWRPLPSWPLTNVWLGVSTEDQKWADIRIPALLDTPAAARWISAEPLLGQVDLTRIAWTGGGGTHLDVVHGKHGEPGLWAAAAKKLDWVVVGGESGPGARPMHPAWARSLRDQCVSADVPFLFKQKGMWTWETRLGNPDGTGRDPWAHHDPHAYVNEHDGRVADESTAMAAGGSWMGVYRVGKGKAGRVLDGRTWDEYPREAA